MVCDTAASWLHVCPPELCNLYLEIIYRPFTTATRSSLTIGILSLSNMDLASAHAADPLYSQTSQCSGTQLSWLLSSPGSQRWDNRFTLLLDITGGRREELKATCMVLFDDVLMCIFRKTISNSEINLDFLQLKFCCVNILMVGGCSMRTHVRVWGCEDIILPHFNICRIAMNVCMYIWGCVCVWKTAAYPGCMEGSWYEHASMVSLFRKHSSLIIRI